MMPAWISWLVGVGGLVVAIMHNNNDLTGVVAGMSAFIMLQGTVTALKEG